MSVIPGALLTNKSDELDTVGAICTLAAGGDDWGTGSGSNMPLRMSMGIGQRCLTVGGMQALTLFVRFVALRMPSCLQVSHWTWRVLLAGFELLVVGREQSKAYFVHPWPAALHFRILVPLRFALATRLCARQRGSRRLSEARQWRPCLRRFGHPVARRRDR